MGEEGDVALITIIGRNDKISQNELMSKNKRGEIMRKIMNENTVDSDKDNAGNSTYKCLLAIIYNAKFDYQYSMISYKSRLKIIKEIFKYILPGLFVPSTIFQDILYTFCKIGDLFIYLQ